MPSTVADIFSAVGTQTSGVVRWGDLPNLPESPSTPATGVYVVSLTSGSDSLGGVLGEAPISRVAVGELLAVRPELTVDGGRPTTDQLMERLAAFWFPDEVVVYIGLAGPRAKRPRDGEL